MSNNYEINIVHLFPELLNLYGDKGNIACLEKRLKDRKVSVKTVRVNKIEELELGSADIVFLGGGSDAEQENVCGALMQKKDELKAYTEAGGVFLAFCGGFEMIGNYFYSGGVRTEGLSILDIYTDMSDNRMIGNVVLQSEIVSQKIVGFENHGGKTFIGGYTPLGKVLAGFGNDGESGAEGLIYKGVVATHLHGPLLPKNPMLCDYIISRAIERKYADFKELEVLDDTIENKANEYIVKTFAEKK